MEFITKTYEQLSYLIAWYKSSGGKKNPKEVHIVVTIIKCLPIIFFYLLTHIRGQTKSTELISDATVSEKIWDF